MESTKLYSMKNEAGFSLVRWSSKLNMENKWLLTNRLKVIESSLLTLAYNKSQKIDLCFCITELEMQSLTIVEENNEIKRGSFFAMSAASFLPVGWISKLQTKTNVHLTRVGSDYTVQAQISICNKTSTLSGHFWRCRQLHLLWCSQLIIISSFFINIRIVIISSEKLEFHDICGNFYPRRLQSRFQKRKISSFDWLWFHNVVY